MSDLGTTASTIDEERPEVVAAARQRSRRGISLEVVGLYVICITGALVLAALLVAATGGSWTAVFSAILDGSVRNHGRIGLTLAVSAPILIVALGTIVSGRAGLVNIGQEGQLVMGSCFAAFAADRLAGPGPFVLITSLLVGIVGGAIWAGIAGVLRYWRNVPEVLTTLLLGSVAANLMGLALRHRSLLLAPASGRANRNQVSEPLPDDTRIPRVTWFGNEFPISVFVAIGLAIVALDRPQPHGGRVPAAHARTQPRHGDAAGVAERRYGLARCSCQEVSPGSPAASCSPAATSANYQLVANFGAGIGFAGLLAALVARQRVLLAIFVAFIFGGLRTGSGFLRATGVSGRIADVVQGLLVLSLLLPPAVLYVRERRRALAATTARTTRR